MMRARVPARCACAMAAASASAASACFDAACGQAGARTIASTCSLPAWPTPTTRFLDVVGRVFGDLEPGLRRGQQRHGAGMAELERGRRILVHEGLLHRDGAGVKLGDDARDFAVQRQQAQASSSLGRGRDHAMGHMAELRARHSITPQPMRPRPGSRPRMRIDRHSEPERIANGSVADRGPRLKVARWTASVSLPAWPAARPTIRNCHRRAGRRRGRPALRSA